MSFETLSTNRDVAGPRIPRAVVSGLTLVAIAAFALWATADLPQGTMRAMGPAMLPRSLAIGVGLCGVALVAFAFLRREEGEAAEGWTLRGPAFVLVAIALFAVTLRPLSIWGVSTPDFGLVVAGPLAIAVGGFASPEARLRDLVVLGFGLTAFCMILFGDLLNLPMPLYPQAVSDLFPTAWSNDARLRSAAALLAVAAAAIHYAGPRRRAGPIDIAPNTGQIA